MAGNEWFRNTTWTPEVASHFELKLRRARNKGEYLRVQATYLVRDHPKVAIELVDRYLALPNECSQSWALCTKARALEALGRLGEAVAAYEQALAREAEMPNYISNAYVDLPTLIVEHQMTEHYGRALEILREQAANVAFPVGLFQWHAASAIVLEFQGNISDARIHARAALDAAGAEHSGVERHPDIGLVGTRHSKLLARIRHLGHG